MKNAIETAIDILEGEREGYFGDLVQLAFDSNGLVHISPDCVLLCAQDEKDPSVLVVLYAGGVPSHLGYLAEISSARWKKIVWANQLRANHSKRLKEADIKQFARIAKHQKSWAKTGTKAAH